MKELCFWSVGDNDFAWMLQGLVASFRKAGMQEDFIAFSDRPIAGARTEIVKEFDKKAHLFKFTFLKKLLKEDYRAFIFLDADTLFVRRPPDLLPLLKDSPVHAFFECDCTIPGILRQSWWGCPLEKYVELMRDSGVTSEKVYNVNAGLFMVEKNAIETVCSLAEDFWNYSLSCGYAFTEEPPLAYALHMLSQNPEFHLIKNHFDIWASDWTAQFKDKLPEGKPWMFKDWLQGDEFIINPAIVHALKSKDLLIRNGKEKSFAAS